MSLSVERPARVRSPYLLATEDLSSGRSGIGWLGVGLLLLFGLALQSTLLNEVTLFGVTPQIVLVAVVCLAYLEGPSFGVTVGFAAGLLLDFMLPGSILGLSALVYTIVAYLVADLRRYSSHASSWMPVSVVAVASAVTESGYALLAVMLGEEWVGLGETSRIVALIVLYNTLLTPFLFPLLARLNDRARPTGAGRSSR